MPNSKFFGIPFGTSGDKAAIPEASQPSGAVSWQQGFGPDYERDPATDPLAKRVPRDETNEFYFQTSNAIRFLQLYGLPEWYALDDSGNPVSYPIAARVRHLDQAWVSVSATNTAVPGTDPTKWALDEAFSIPASEASAAEVAAATIGTKLITPRRLPAPIQQSLWTYKVTGGSASALTLALAPALPALVEGTRVQFRVHVLTGTEPTLDVNGSGAFPLVRTDRTLLDATLALGSIHEAVFHNNEWVLLTAPPASNAGRGVVSIQEVRDIAGAAALTALTRARNVGVISAPDATVVQTPFSSFADDGQADFTLVSGNLRCNRARRFLISGAFSMAANGIPLSAVSVGIRLNGADLATMSLRISTGNAIEQLFGGQVRIVNLAVNDVLSGWLLQSSTVTRNITMSSYIDIQRLSAL